MLLYPQEGRDHVWTCSLLPTDEPCNVYSLFFKKAKVWRIIDSNGLSADFDALAFFQSLHLLFIIYIEHKTPTAFWRLCKCVLNVSSILRRLLSPTCLSCCHRENHSSLPRSWIRASFECHPHYRGKWTNRSSDRHLSQALGQICLVSSVIQMPHWIKISFFVKWGNWNWSLSLCLALRILDFRFASLCCFLVFCLFFRCTFQRSSYKIDLFGNPSYYLNFRAKWKFSPKETGNALWESLKQQMCSSYIQVHTGKRPASAFWHFKALSHYWKKNTGRTWLPNDCTGKS